MGIVFTLYVRSSSDPPPFADVMNSWIFNKPSAHVVLEMGRDGILSAFTFAERSLQLNNGRHGDFLEPSLHVVLLSFTLFTGRKTPSRAVCLLPLGKSLPAYATLSAFASVFAKGYDAIIKATARQADESHYFLGHKLRNCLHSLRSLNVRSSSDPPPFACVPLCGTYPRTCSALTSVQFLPICPQKKPSTKRY
jgi:hypothetical protein